MQTLFQQQDTPSEKLWAVLRSHRVTASLVMLATFVAIVAGVGYQRFAYAQSPDPNFNSQVAHPAYRDTHPRVLFDAAHFNFHTATGNYKPFADLIRNDGYEVVSNKKTFSRKTLGGYRVLVIANALGSKGVLVMLANLMGWHSAPQWDLAAFTPEECDAVRDWVAEGGSLLLISDHAPTGKAAQGLSLRFGVDMSNWFTEDDQHSDPDAYSFLVFSRDNGLLISSPITEGRNPNERLNRVMTFTGQSLKGPQESVSFLRLADSAREYPGRESTFPAGRPAAGRAQGIALTFGKGRAVVLGEAAMLSAQVFRIPGRELRLGMEYPGCDNRQLALNIMHWLSGLLN